ncbi:hypothetical protein CJ179_00475 [Rhodococcus sp. ACS1]|nr:hypothetical protein CJ179_00475 [Rhodococcus sp. ACS1]
MSLDAHGNQAKVGYSVTWRDHQVNGQWYVARFASGDCCRSSGAPNLPLRFPDGTFETRR